MQSFVNVEINFFRHTLKENNTNMYKLPNYTNIYLPFSIISGVGRKIDLVLFWSF